MAQGSMPVSRRKFLKLATTALASFPVFLAGAEKVLAGRSSGAAGSAAGRGVVNSHAPLRIISVPTAVDGGILPALVESFRAETGLKAVVTSTEDPYTPAGKGKYDLVISHFGHRDTEKFVLDGFGQWPRTVFSNQLALFGPHADPANVRGLPDLVQAFRRIAQAGVPYVLDDTHGIRYLTEIVWRAAGKPAKGSWFIDRGLSKGAAVAYAAEYNGYVLWGLTPFLQEQKAMHLPLEPLVTADPLLQRIMVSVVVNPDRVSGVNASGASIFQRYLLSPASQSRMLEIHYPGTRQAVWAPAGRNNPGSVLPE
jgi:tungstate transport system substrate-binding protein